MTRGGEVMKVLTTIRAGVGLENMAKAMGRNRASLANLSSSHCGSLPASDLQVIIDPTLPLQQITLEYSDGTTKTTILEGYNGS